MMKLWKDIGISQWPSAVDGGGGDRTRSNGKWSKEVAIMDNGLIGKWSNWIMI